MRWQDSRHFCIVWMKTVSLSALFICMDLQLLINEWPPWTGLPRNFCGLFLSKFTSNRVFRSTRKHRLLSRSDTGRKLPPGFNQLSWTWVGQGFLTRSAQKSQHFAASHIHICIRARATCSSVPAANVPGLPGARACLSGGPRPFAVPHETWRPARGMAK